MRKAHVSDPDEQEGCRESAAEILVKVERRNAYADILLDELLKESALKIRDRALLTQIVYGTLRWQGRIDWHLGRALHRPLAGMNPYLRSVLRLTLYQTLFLDKVPDYAAVNEGVELAKRYGGEKAGGLVNSVIRKILREKDEDYYPNPQEDPVSYLSVFWSHPEWLVKKWLDYFGKAETEALLKADNDESPLVLRVNRLKGDRAALIEKLRGMGFDADPTVWSPQGIRVKSTSAVNQLPGFQEGLFQVQGEASQLVGYLLDPQPGERILDACSAPGGKTTHLAELFEDEGEIVATDVSTRGLEKLRQNVQRLSLTSVRHVCVDVAQGLVGPTASPYDRILVDAPCSALGTLRSHPEAKWQKSERDIERLSKLQKNILSRVSSYLKPGGVLVYATCTLAPEENEEVVGDFLSRHEDFVLEDAGAYLPRAARDLACGHYLLALPHKHNTDGFFAARLGKVAKAT